MEYSFVEHRGFPTCLICTDKVMSGNIYDQLSEKAKHFHSYLIALDESTDVTDTAQLAIYVRGVDDNCDVTEELLTIIPTHGQTTGQEIDRHLCDSIVNAGLPWKNGLVALLQTGRGGCGRGLGSALHYPGG